ncbi:MAG: SPW repeat domain-containing protein, partial [bacterium]
CTLCLAAAFVMLLMIPFTVDEVIAMGQFLAKSVREGKSFWRTFWVGGTMEGGEKDSRTPSYGSPVRKMAPAMIWGVTAPWPLIISAVLGIWLIFAPAIFGTEGNAANSDRLVGALIVTVAVIAMAEVVRAGRFLNVLFGAWIIVAPWLLNGAATSAKWNGVITGAVLILLSLRRGQIREPYGSWGRYIF